MGSEESFEVLLERRKVLLRRGRVVDKEPARLHDDQVGRVAAESHRFPQSRQIEAGGLGGSIHDIGERLRPALDHAVRQSAAVSLEQVDVGNPGGGLLAQVHDLLRSTVGLQESAQRVGHGLR
jgi:hypothetical protein